MCTTRTLPGQMPIRSLEISLDDTLQTRAKNPTQQGLRQRSWPFWSLRAFPVAGRTTSFSANYGDRKNPGLQQSRRLGTVSASSRIFAMHW